ncbi:hypothetical protein QZH41_011604 [Actinostola sp. cb2023]|nr:hypothetical protein QZH41_011604 [Actinostola sp. cb2023]
MYSIAERSFEGMSSFKQDDQNESTSDKENNIYDNYDNQTLYRNQAHDYKDDFEERYSSGMESRPISVHSKQSIRKDRRRSSLYVRQEFQKQFKIEMNKESSGRDKFSILSAYAKGFMTRHLLQTEKVQALIKTIKDTSEFLADISREGTTCHQDKSLQQRVQAQLVAAKSKLYDIFFTIPISERMAYVAHSRNAAREREDRINAKSTAPSNQRTRKLSAATMKAMQRRQVETYLCILSQTRFNTALFDNRC